MALSIKLANFFIRTWIKVSWQKCCFWMSLQLQITLHTLIYILVRCIPSQYLAIVLPVYVHLTWSCTTHSSYCLVNTKNTWPLFCNLFHKYKFIITGLYRITIVTGMLCMITMLSIQNRTLFSITIFHILMKLDIGNTVTLAVCTQIPLYIIYYLFSLRTSSVLG